jgi:hypothetical protein
MLWTWITIVWLVFYNSKNYALCWLQNIQAGLTVQIFLSSRRLHLGYILCMDFGTNSDYCPTQYYLIGQGVRLQRGKCYIFTCVSVKFSFLRSPRKEMIHHFSCVTGALCSQTMFYTEFWYTFSLIAVRSSEIQHVYRGLLICYLTLWILRLIYMMYLEPISTSLVKCFS